MTDYVRVKDKSTGHKLSLSTAHGAPNPEAYEVLESADATDVNGDPLPVEYAEPRPAKKTTTRKPAARKAASAKKATPASEETTDA